jgi:hypothetical protein
MNDAVNVLSIWPQGPRPYSRNTVKRAYLAKRKELGMPERCDIPCCAFHAGPLEWNGVALSLILDHESGNSADNTFGNLRLLCPNCNSQQEATGGSNKGRIVN